jgi:hypothetical protein
MNIFHFRRYTTIRTTGSSVYNELTESACSVNERPGRVTQHGRQITHVRSCCTTSERGVKTKRRRFAADCVRVAYKRETDWRTRWPGPSAAGGGVFTVMCISYFVYGTPVSVARDRQVATDTFTSKQAKVVPLHATKALGEERRYSSYSFSTSALDGLVVSVTPRPHFTPGTHWIGGWVGLSAGLDRGLRKNPSPLLGIELRPTQLLSNRYRG